MNSLAAVSVLIGTIIIISRGALLLAPLAMGRIYKRLLATKTRIRFLGLFMGLVGSAAILAARGSDQVAALFMQAIGWIMAFGGFVVVMIFADFYKRLADTILEAMDELMLRMLGFFSICLGAFFIYLGVAVFSH